MMKKAMIVQPTSDRSGDEINQTYDKAVDILTKQGYLVGESEECVISSEVKHEGIYNISKYRHARDDSWTCRPHCIIIFFNSKVELS